MIHRLFRVAPVVVTTILLGLPTLGEEHKTFARFDLPFDSPQDGPFPSNWFTVEDGTQNTGLRVSLSKTECQVSDCEDLDVINELDGFNLQPRVSIPFSGTINPHTVTGETVFLVGLGSTLPGQEGSPPHGRISVDQVVWDPTTETLHVESDELLDQHTRYVLVVTKGVQDANGKDVKPAKEFLHFVDDAVTESTGDLNLDAYRGVLRTALTELDTHGIVPKGQVVAASVFTTRSATAVLEKIRDQIHEVPPDPADFLLGPAGERTVFARSEITAIAWFQQKLVNAPYFPDPPVAVPVALLNLFPGSVGRVAFGKYVSPDYQVHPEQYIPAIGTRTGTPAAEGTNEIHFNLFLPSGSMPSNGWPVVIVGHGVNNSKNVLPLQVASSMAKYGLATIAINAVGHGFGRESLLRVTRTVGAPIDFPAGGRGIDQNDDGRIDDSEGLGASRPRTAVVFSDSYRQTAVDLMQLTRVIEVGMDVDGNGLPDLDPSRIYYFGNSLGGGYGSVFLAVERHVAAGVIAVPFDPIPGGLRGAFRSVPGTMAASREPSLINFPGITTIFPSITTMNGVPVGSPFFDDNLPLRSQTGFAVQLEDSTTRIIQSPVVNTVAGAMDLQAVGERLEWVSLAGSPLGYAPHLRKAPLAGMVAKPVIYQIAKGDWAAPNPTTTAIMRAGDLSDSTLYYLHEVARAEIPALPANPHGFAVAVNNVSFRAIALAAQDMAGRFFFSDGGPVTGPQPSRFFEYPILFPLPEGFNFINP